MACGLVSQKQARYCGPRCPGGRAAAIKWPKACFHLPDIGTLQKVDRMTEQSDSQATGGAPVVAQKTPYAVEVEAGKKYWWCSCGQSAKQPFCDGSHKGTDFTPFEHEADKDGTLHFCGCKATTRVPLCDGSHSKL
mgnify:CR=1 FL=1